MNEQPVFVCDEMLARLGRWLRAAGYDTLIAAPGTDDRALFQLALAQGRWLITRDRKFLEYKDAADHVICLGGNSLTHSAEELSTRLAIDWLFRPFSRCLVCNALLEQADRALLAQVPEKSRARVSAIFRCQGCHRLYWEGSHVRRMQARLRDWHRQWS